MIAAAVIPICSADIAIKDVLFRWTVRAVKTFWKLRKAAKTITDGITVSVSKLNSPVKV